MNCSNQLYITLFIVLIFILIFINYKVCKYNKIYKIDIIESFRNNSTYGQNDKDTSKYLFACVDENGNLNQYYVPGDGSMWSNAVNFAENGGNKPSYVREAKENASWAKAAIGGNRDDIPGILCYNDTNSIFKWMGNNENNNSANSYGTGTNSRQAVINLMSSDITAPNFANNHCTKERWYLFKDQSGTNYIYAVFKRNPWRDDLDCCSNYSGQRNSCNDSYIDSTSSNCNNYMKEYCTATNSGNNITNNICQNWCTDSRNSTTCKNHQISFCNSSKFKNNKDFCKSKCKKGECDLGVSDYCNYIVSNSLPNDDYCACFGLNAKASTSRAVVQALEELNLSESDPVCYSTNCRSGIAYTTQSMDTAVNGCPKCLQTMTLTNLASADNIKQTCNVNTSSNETTPTSLPESDTNPYNYQNNSNYIRYNNVSTPVSTPVSKPNPKPAMTLNDYLDSITLFINNILDSISNLFNN
jgi:hypothetical protein